MFLKVKHKREHKDGEIRKWCLKLLKIKCKEWYFWANILREQMKSEAQYFKEMCYGQWELWPLKIISVKTISASFWNRESKSW